MVRNQSQHKKAEKTADKRKQLTTDDRHFIQSGLDRGERVSKIASALGRTSQVIVDEIKRNRTSNVAGLASNRKRNVCRYRDVCTESDVCDVDFKNKYCYNCPDMKCNQCCSRFEPAPCDRHQKTPFCCNGCPSLHVGRDCGCGYLVYDASVAEEAATTRRSESRKGIDATPEQLERIREVAEDGITFKGQSPEHVVAAHPDLGVSAQTLRRYIDLNLIENVTRADLPSAVKRRSRKSDKGKYAPNAVPREYLKDRKYEDWLALPDEERRSTVEMDTVIGSKSNKKSILSLQWPDPSFQAYLLLDRHTSSDVVNELDKIQDAVGLDEFRRMLPIIKTDRGTEFSDAYRIEHDKEGNRRCRLFYCDAYNSQQKPHVERGHEELRRILPKKGSDFDKLTRPDMALIMSHVNSMPRASLGGLSPISKAKDFLGPLLDAFSVAEIPAVDVIRNPKLIPHAIIPGTESGRRKGLED